MLVVEILKHLFNAVQTIPQPTYYRLHNNPLLWQLQHGKPIGLPLTQPLNRNSSPHVIPDAQRPEMFPYLRVTTTVWSVKLHQEL